MGVVTKPKNKPTDIGGRIAFVRKNAGMSQDELATMLGVTREYLSMIEGGKAGRRPSIDMVETISKHLRVSCDYLIRGSDTKNIDIQDRLGLTDRTINALEHLRFLNMTDMLFINSIFEVSAPDIDSNLDVNKGWGCELDIILSDLQSVFGHYIAALLEPALLDKNQKTTRDNAQIKIEPDKDNPGMFIVSNVDADGYLDTMLQQIGERFRVVLRAGWKKARREAFLNAMKKNKAIIEKYEQREVLSNKPFKKGKGDSK